MQSALRFENDFQLKIDWIIQAETCENWLSDQDQQKLQQFRTRAKNYNVIFDNIPERTRMHTVDKYLAQNDIYRPFWHKQIVYPEDWPLIQQYIAILKRNPKDAVTKAKLQKLSATYDLDLEKIIKGGDAGKVSSHALSFVGMQQAVLLSEFLESKSTSYALVAPTIPAIVTALLSLRSSQTQILILPHTCFHRGNQLTTKYLRYDLLEKKISTIKKWLDVNWVSEFDDIRVMESLKIILGTIKSTPYQGREQDVEYWFLVNDIIHQIQSFLDYRPNQLQQSKDLTYKPYIEALDKNHKNIFTKLKLKKAAYNANAKSYLRYILIQIDKLQNLNTALNATPKSESEIQNLKRAIPTSESAKSSINIDDLQTQAIPDALDAIISWAQNEAENLSENDNPIQEILANRTLMQKITADSKVHDSFQNFLSEMRKDKAQIKPDKFQGIFLTKLRSWYTEYRHNSIESHLRSGPKMSDINAAQRTYYQAAMYSRFGTALRYLQVVTQDNNWPQVNIQDLQKKNFDEVLQYMLPKMKSNDQYQLLCFVDDADVREFLKIDPNEKLKNTQIIQQTITKNSSSAINLKYRMPISIRETYHDFDALNINVCDSEKGMYDIYNSGITLKPETVRSEIRKCDLTPNSCKYGRDILNLIKAEVRS